MRRTVHHACFSLIVVAQIAFLAGVADAQIKIACVGDSITADPNSWCVVLDQKLGSDYTVRNFGVSGTCALKGCDAPYWSTAEFKSSHDFAPDIVIIMLGTNDSKPSNWNRGKGQFAADYGALIDSYTSLGTDPRVYAIIVIPAGKNDWAVSGTTIANELNPIIKQVAMAKMITTIDGFNAFGGVMFDQSLFSASDQVHPYPKGHQVLGNAVYEVLMSSGGLGGTGGMDAGTGGVSAGTGGKGAIGGSAAAGGAGGIGGSHMGGATAGASGASSGGAGGGAIARGVAAGSGSSSVTGGSSAGSRAAGTSNTGGTISTEAGGSAAAAGTGAVSAPEAERGGGGCQAAGRATSSGPMLVLLPLFAIASRRRANRIARRT